MYVLSGTAWSAQDSNWRSFNWLYNLSKLWSNVRGQWSKEIISWVIWCPSYLTRFGPHSEAAPSGRLGWTFIADFSVLRCEVIQDFLLMLKSEHSNISSREEIASLRKSSGLIRGIAKSVTVVILIILIIVAAHWRFVLLCFLVENHNQQFNF